MKKDKILYLITATVEPEGLVLSEIFEDEADALLFERNEVRRQLLNEYGHGMANSDSLTIGFGIRVLHKSAGAPKAG